MRIDPTAYICMGTRYYDPLAGRFMSPDPLGHAASMDLYSYANGDPINLVDPTGRKPIGVPEREGDPTGKPPPETQNDVPFNPNLSWQNITDSVNNAMEEARNQAALAEQRARADAFFNSRDVGFGTIGGIATDLQRNATSRRGTGVSRNEDLSISFNVDGPPIAVVDGSYGSAYTQADLLQLYSSGVMPLGEDKGNLIPFFVGGPTAFSWVFSGVGKAAVITTSVVGARLGPPVIEKSIMVSRIAAAKNTGLGGIGKLYRLNTVEGLALTQVNTKLVYNTAFHGMNIYNKGAMVGTAAYASTSGVTGFLSFADGMVYGASPAPTPTSLTDIIPPPLNPFGALAQGAGNFFGEYLFGGPLLDPPLE